MAATEELLCGDDWIYRRPLFQPPRPRHGVTPKFYFVLLTGFCFRDSILDSVQREADQERFAGLIRLDAGGEAGLRTLRTVLHCAARPDSTTNVLLVLPRPTQTSNSSYQVGSRFVFVEGWVIVQECACELQAWTRVGGICYVS